MYRSLLDRMEIQVWGTVGVIMLDGMPYAYSSPLPYNFDANEMTEILRDIIREVEGIE